MKTPVRYGPGRGLKKPRGPRAKAAIRRAAKTAAHIRALAPRGGGMRDLLNEARWATVKAGGKWRDLRRIKPNPATGVLAFVFRAGCDVLAVRVAEAMRDSLPCYVTTAWSAES